MNVFPSPKPAESVSQVPQDSELLLRLVISPCCNPELNFSEALKAYSELGFRKFEAFTGWVKSAVDIYRDPREYRDVADRCGMRVVSFHLPPVREDRADSLERAVAASRFARTLGADIVLFKATTRPLYIAHGRPFLDAIEGTGLTAVIQNHSGSAISTLDHFEEVLDGIDDPRMKAILEVGHFHSVGVSWKQGWELLRDRVALVHIKDQIGRQSVPFGEGEIDLPGLFGHLRTEGYSGDFVVEMEVVDRENTLTYLQRAIRYLEEKCWESGS